MEYLLFDFPFRENTLVQEAFQLPPATVLSYDLATGGALRKSRFANGPLMKPKTATRARK
jgi:hypothetical protein